MPKKNQQSTSSTISSARPKSKGFWRFGERGALPSDVSRETIEDTFEWWLTRTPGFKGFLNHPMVLPDESHFPLSLTDPKDVALPVAKYAGLEGLKVSFERLPALASSSDLWGPEVAFGAGAGRSGSISTMRVEDEEVVISYAPHLAKKLNVFVAAMAYEIAHVVYLFSDPPEDEDLSDEEQTLAYELGACFLGFGIFTANSTYNLSSFQGVETQGYDIDSLGELSERETCYALALFMSLLEIPFGEVKEHLNSNPRSYVKHGLRFLEREGSELLARLRSVEGTPAIE